MKNIKSEEIEEIIANGAVVLDVRTEDEFSEGYIPGAINMEIGEMSEEEIEKLDKEKTYLLYCRSGGRSSRAAQMLDFLGFKNVYNLEGGYMEWVKKKS
ncbi:MAG: thiosulfate sulfurtransferase [Parcubacteria group bacterium LiPW_30]|nr:MAG: thiosulfate sulfurtransferase [Parcubacteria group bacterium LiPW_30]